MVVVGSTASATKSVVMMLGIIALFAASLSGFPIAHAEEGEEYTMVEDLVPVLTFTFRDGVETHRFPVFNMGENFVDNSGVSFSVQGTVSSSPLLHKALDEAYKYRFSNSAFDYQFKYFDIDADFVKNDQSVVMLDYNNCRVENYQVETLDSNDHESYFKNVGFVTVDKIDFICSGVSVDGSDASAPPKFHDYGESGFKFANDVRATATFFFENGVEKIQFPVFNLLSGYAESQDNVVVEFQVEGVLDYYPLLYTAIDQSRKVSGLSTASNVDFDVSVEFENSESVQRGFDFDSCRISDAQIRTHTDKEEGFTGKSGFVLVNQMRFLCYGLDPVNDGYDKLYDDSPVWNTPLLSNNYVEPIRNADRDLSIATTFTFVDGVETVEFSLFKQSKVLSTTVDVDNDNGDKSVAAEAFTRKTAYPTLELRGIVGDYPMLYNHVDDGLKIQSVSGTNSRTLADIDVQLVSKGVIVREFNYVNCRSVDYVVYTGQDREESYVKNQFTIENIFDFECQGYHPVSPAYDALNAVESADLESSSDLRNTDQWAPNFTVRK